MKSEHYVPLSQPRLLMRDAGHFAHRSYAAGMNATLNVSPLAKERRRHRPPIGWTALLVKALAVIGRRTPALRQVFMPFPWPHLYQHPRSVATIVVERGWGGEAQVFFDQVQGPEELSLVEVDTLIRGMKFRPVESVGAFRRIIRFGRMPTPLRRLVSRAALSISGRVRARYFGTFSINSIPAPRTEVLQSFTPLTLSLFYGYVEPNGDVLIQVLWDQRVIDGRPIRRMLSELESTLNGEIVAELQGRAAAVDLAGVDGRRSI
jgi:hypothetical protein